jgi:hypothetical protein
MRPSPLHAGGEWEAAVPPSDRVRYGVDAVAASPGGDLLAARNQPAFVRRSCRSDGKEA